MNNEQLNPDWLVLEQNLVGRVVLTKMDPQTPYLILDDQESLLFHHVFNNKQISHEMGQQLGPFKTMLKTKGIFQTMTDLNQVYKYSENLLKKIMPDERVSIVMADDMESMFVIDGLMVEVFHELAHAKLTLQHILDKQLDEYEVSEHSELTKYITDFFNDLREKGIIIPA